MIFAGLGLADGILGSGEYGVLVVVVLSTTIVAPPLLRWRLLRMRRTRTKSPELHGTLQGGQKESWLAETDGIIELLAEPPTGVAAEVALQAARRVGRRRPGPRLVEWLASVAGSELEWTKRDTGEFISLLLEGNARSWRFLEATGFLNRAVPELAKLVEARRRDPFDLDPGGPFTWDLPFRFGELAASDAEFAAEYGRLEHPEWLLLAAFLIDVSGDGQRLASAEELVKIARLLVHRLDLGAAAEEEISTLVGETALLEAASRRSDSFGEGSVLKLATHLGTPETARALYLLTVASRDLEVADRQRVRELYELVQEALSHPELTSRSVRNHLERRRAEALREVCGDKRVRHRIHEAPRGYLLAMKAEDVARHARLLEPLPRRNEVRVRVHGPIETPQQLEDGSEWTVDIACRDRVTKNTFLNALQHGVSGLKTKRRFWKSWLGPLRGSLVALKHD